MLQTELELRFWEIRILHPLLYSPSLIMCSRILKTILNRNMNVVAIQRVINIFVIYSIDFV